jgi:hypothetical protein
MQQQQHQFQNGHYFETRTSQSSVVLVDGGRRPHHYTITETNSKFIATRTGTSSQCQSCHRKRFQHVIFDQRDAFDHEGFGQRCQQSIVSTRTTKAKGTILFTTVCGIFLCSSIVCVMDEDTNSVLALVRQREVGQKGEGRWLAVRR